MGEGRDELGAARRSMRLSLSRLEYEGAEGGPTDLRSVLYRHSPSLSSYSSENRRTYSRGPTQMVCNVGKVLDGHLRRTFRSIDLV